MLVATDYNREAILLQQRELLSARVGELASALALIETTLAELNGSQESPMNKNSEKAHDALFTVFPELDENLQAEAEQRRGHSAPWQQSAQHAARYTKAAWQCMKDAMAAQGEEARRVFKAGFTPESAEAVAVAEAARLLIHQWHYACSPQFHVNLTAMTSNDPRFVANIDRDCAGLAAWLHAASTANAAG